MRVTTKDEYSEITSEPYVPGPKPVLYDHNDRPLKRPIGFRTGSLDNHRSPAVNSRPLSW